MALARNLAPESHAFHRETCRAIVGFIEQGLGSDELRKHTTPPLLSILMSTDDPGLRRDGLRAMSAVAPELTAGAENFIRYFEQHLDARRRQSYAATPTRAELPVPPAESLVISARWLTSAIYLGRAFPTHGERVANKSFADAVLSTPHILGTIEANPDTLALHRATLPRDIIDAQENLDSLVPLKLIPGRVVIARFVRSKAPPFGSDHHRPGQ